MPSWLWMSGWLLGCSVDCATVVPDDAVVLDGTISLKKREVGVVCPDRGAEVVQNAAEVHVAADGRLVVLGNDTRVWAAERAEITVLGTYVEVMAHPSAEVDIQGEGSTVQTCGVEVELPAIVEAKCAGTWVPEPTADTGGRAR